MRDAKRFSNIFDLTGRVAIVTGAAQGNGAGIANALFDAGAVVVATDIAFPDEKQGVAQGLHPDVHRMIMDVTDECQVEAVFAEIAKQHKSIDILCNNAGIIYKAPVDELSLDRFKKVTDINIHGTVICTKHAVPYMKKGGWGRIVNIASSQSFLSTETYSAYSASKAAVSHLTRVWGSELAGDNIFVNALCPSFVNTPMMKQSIAAVAAQNNVDRDTALSHYTDQIPMHRLLEIEEIGNWATALCSHLGDATTGCNISITGGHVHL